MELGLNNEYIIYLHSFHMVDATQFSDTGAAYTNPNFYGGNFIFNTNTKINRIALLNDSLTNRDILYRVGIMTTLPTVAGYQELNFLSWSDVYPLNWTAATYNYVSIPEVELQAGQEYFAALNLRYKGPSGSIVLNTGGAQNAMGFRWYYPYQNVDGTRTYNHTKLCLGYNDGSYTQWYGQPFKSTAYNDIAAGTPSMGCKLNIKLNTREIELNAVILRIHYSVGQILTLEILESDRTTRVTNAVSTYDRNITNADTIFWHKFSFGQGVVRLKPYTDYYIKLSATGTPTSPLSSGSRVYWQLTSGFTTSYTNEDLDLNNAYDNINEFYTISNLNVTTNYPNIRLFCMLICNNLVDSYRGTKEIYNPPSYATSGLKLYIDASNLNSYPGYGSTWFDLSGNYNNLMMSGNVEWSSKGYFNFDGNTQATSEKFENYKTNIVGSRQPFTAEILFSNDYMWGGGAANVFYLGGVPSIQADNNGLFLQTDAYPNGAVSGRSALIGRKSGATNIGLTYSHVKLWEHVTATYDGTTFTAYRNGAYVNRVTDTSYNFTKDTFNIGEVISNFSSYWFDGQINTVRLYNRPLTYTEVQQNYDSLKNKINVGTFGLNTINYSTNGLSMHLDATDFMSYPGPETSIYPFLSTFGTSWIDMSGNQRNGFLIGGATYSRNPGNIIFDGVDDHVQASGAITTNEATFVTWIKRNGTQTSNAGILFSRGTRVTGLNISTSNLLGYTWNDDSATINWNSGLTIPDNQWAMCAISVQTSVATAYLISSSVNMSTTRVGTHTSTIIDDIKLAQDDLGSRFFKGNIAVAQIYNRALDVSEIRQNFNSYKYMFELGYLDPNLRLFVDFSNPNCYSGIGTTVNDLSGNNRIGTIFNSTFNYTRGGYFDFVKNTTNRSRISFTPSSGALSGSTPFTMNIWAKVNLTDIGFEYVRSLILLGHDSQYISSGSYQNLSLSVGGVNLAAGVYSFRAYGNSGTDYSSEYNANVGPSHDSWFYLSFIYDGLFASLYENGIKILGPVKFPLNFTSTFEISIGKHIANDNRDLTGSVGLVSIYNRILTPDEILQTYNDTKERFLINHKINTRGLVQFYDPSLSQSYPGTGTLWYDYYARNQGLLTNGPTFSSSDGGGSIVFDGTNDHVAITPVTQLPSGKNPSTIIGWAEHDVTPTGPRLLYIYGNNGTNQARYIGLDASGAYAFGGLGDNVTQTYDFESNKYFQVAGVYDGTNAYLYANGDLIKGPILVSSWTTLLSQSIIGKNINNDFYWDGNIAQVSVYNRTLTSAEIYNNYTSQRDRFYSMILALDPALTLYSLNLGTTFLDVSNYKTYGSVFTNDPTFSTSNSGVISFDGTNDSIGLNNSIPVDFFTKKWSVSFWLKLGTLVTSNDFAVDRLLLHHGQDLNSPYGIQLSQKNSRFEFLIYPSSSFQSVATLSTTLWYNVVFTMDNDTRLRQIFINGVFDSLSTSTASYTYGTGYLQNSKARIGDKSGGGFGSPFRGQMGRIEFYNKVLSTTEVLTNFNEYKGRYGYGAVTTSGLVLLLDPSNSSSYSGTGTTWTDLSGNNYNFTISTTAFSTIGGIPHMDFSSSATGAAIRIVNSVRTDVPSYSTATIIVFTSILPSTASFRTLLRGASNDHQVIINTNTNDLGMFDISSGTGFIDSTFNVDSMPNYTLDFNMMCWRLGTSSPFYQFQYNNDSTIYSITNTNATFDNGFCSIGGYHNIQFLPTGMTQYWGKIAYFAYYSRHLSTSEINDIYTNLRWRHTFGQDSGIVRYFDAGATASYSGSGTTWADMSNTSRIATLINGPTYSSSHGGSIDFDGTNDYANFNSTASLPTARLAGTIMAWAKTDSIASGDKIIFSYGTSVTSQSRFIGLSTSSFVFGGFSDNITSSTLFATTDTWFHITGIYDGTNASLYVNGVLIAGPTSKTSWNTGSQTAQIGRLPNGSGYWTGNISQLLVYNRAIAGNEVLKYFNMTRSRYNV